jgi:hypothetical protein
VNKAPAIRKAAAFASSRTTAPTLCLIATMAAGLGLAGCTVDRPVPPEKTDGQVIVAPGIGFSLLPPAALGRSVEATQLVTAHYQHAAFVFETRISVTPARLLLAGTDMLGRRAMTVEWTGQDLKVDAAPWVPPELRARNVLADIMLMHWPGDAVRAGMAPGVSMREPSMGHRVIAVDGLDLIHADHNAGAPGSWNGRWTYQNSGFGYDLDIQSAETSP